MDEAIAFTTGHEVPSDLNSFAKAACRRFTDRHDQRPAWVVAAPGRVNLIGEHTDYNDGFVLPMAIQRYVVVAAAPTNQNAATIEPAACIHSDNLDESFKVSLNRPVEARPGKWSGYVEGVIAGFLERGYAIPPFDAEISSAVPLGGGLSSSAALEVAIATFLETMLGIQLDPVEKALLCQQSEHRFAGVPCGIMDQFSSVFGQEDALLLLDCRSREIQTVPFVSPDVTVLITNSNVQHALAGSEYAARRRECEAAAAALDVGALRDANIERLESHRDRQDDVAYRRARHVITENERTVKCAEAIRQCDWEAAGNLMYASHESLRDDYEVSCRELDLLVELAQDIGTAGGVLGSRMTGGGFGGCTVTLVRTQSAANVAESMRKQYRDKTDVDTHYFATRPARGAHAIVPKP